MGYIKIYIITLVMAVVYTVFVTSIEVLDGGLIGMALIISYLTKWNLGVVYLFLNMPILLWVYKTDKELFKNSLFGMLAFSINTFSLEFYTFTTNANLFIVLIVSGFALGVCFQVMSRLKATFGGISPIGVKLDEWGILKLSKFYLLTDLLVLILGLFIFSFENFLLSLLFVSILSLGVEVSSRFGKKNARKILLVRYETSRV